MMYFIFIISAVFAEDWSGIYSSQSHEDLMTNERILSQQSQIDTRCQNERKGKLFPESCIVMLDQSLNDPVSKESFLSFKKEIDDLCTSQAHQALSQEKIDFWLNQPFLSSSCKRALEVRREDLIYIERNQI